MILSVLCVVIFVAQLHDAWYQGLRSYPLLRHSLHVFVRSAHLGLEVSL